MQVFLVLDAASYLTLPATSGKFTDIVVVLAVAILLFSEDDYTALQSVTPVNTSQSSLEQPTCKMSFCLPFRRWEREGGTLNASTSLEQPAHHFNSFPRLCAKTLGVMAS